MRHGSSCLPHRQPRLTWFQYDEIAFAMFFKFLQHRLVHDFLMIPKREQGLDDILFGFDRVIVFEIVAKVKSFFNFVIDPRKFVRREFSPRLRYIVFRRDIVLIQYSGDH